MLGRGAVRRLLHRMCTVSATGPAVCGRASPHMHAQLFLLLIISLFTLAMPPPPRQRLWNPVLRLPCFFCQWEKYVACNPRPDASVESELNTYIQITRESSESNLDKVLQSCIYTEDIGADVRQHIGRALQAGDGTKAVHYQRILDQMRGCSQQQLDFATSA